MREAKTHTGVPRATTRSFFGNNTALRVVLPWMPIPFTSRSAAALALIAAVALDACAPKPSVAPSPVATPAPPAVGQTCPNASDGASVIIDAIETAHRAMVASGATSLPPVCVVAAFTERATAVPDSINQHALAVATELKRRGPATTELLASEVMLLSRLRQYPEVSRAYDQLAAIDTAPPMNVMRLAIAAARQRADTAALLRVIAKAAVRPGAPQPVQKEFAVLRERAAILVAINQGRGYIRQNARYAPAYPSVVTNFGTLGVTDSVVAYVRRGLANGVTRAGLTPSIEPYVDTALRHAFLYGSTYGWGAPIAAAMRVDSTLTTPSTKFLVASLAVQSIGPTIECLRVAEASSQLDVAEAHLRAGGDRFAASAVSQLVNSISAARGRITALRQSCAR